ncbi:MAG TPA: DoxX family protein [Microlunatus sp.]|nr:DoxX family protein [Microlunatus sp.]
MDYGLLVLRVVLGLLLAGHGAQKLFGWFGGSGLRPTAEGFSQLRYRAPFLVALLGGLTEFVGGLLFATGFLTPLAALGIAALMINAVAVAHWSNGLWATKGGWEYNLLIYAVLIAVVTTGPGAFSIDAVIGLAAATSGLVWAVGVLVLSAVLAAAALTLGRKPDRALTPAPAADAGH